MESWEVKGHTIEFLEEQHMYLVDGLPVPSVTQVLKVKFGGDLDKVDRSLLNKRAEQGTAMHKMIELYEKEGLEADSEELENYKFLKEMYKFNCLGNEVPIIIFDRETNEPLICGTADMIMKLDGKVGIGDLKRITTINKEKVAYQVNLYRIGYQQCYDTNIEFLKCLQIKVDGKNNIRKVIELPIAEEVAWELIEQWKKEKEKC